MDQHDPKVWYHVGLSSQTSLLPCYLYTQSTTPSSPKSTVSQVPTVSLPYLSRILCPSTTLAVGQALEVATGPRWLCLSNCPMQSWDKNAPLERPAKILFSRSLSMAKELTFFSSIAQEHLSSIQTWVTNKGYSLLDHRYWCLSRNYLPVSPP